MPGRAQLAGELADAVSETLGVMKQDDVGHGCSWLLFGMMLGLPWLACFMSRLRERR